MTFLRGPENQFPVVGITPHSCEQSHFSISEKTSFFPFIGHLNGLLRTEIKREKEIEIEMGEEEEEREKERERERERYDVIDS
jgi:hypothetical protein